MTFFAPAFRLLAIATLAVAALAAVAAATAALRIERAYARPTAGGQPGGVYFTIDNRGPGDRLIGVHSEVAAETELHEMRMEGDVMRMRQLESIDLPTGARVTLAPGRLHVMLLGLHAPLRPGQRFPLQLRFEKAGLLTVEIPVETARR